MTLCLEYVVSCISRFLGFLLKFHNAHTIIFNNKAAPSEVCKACYSIVLAVHLHLLPSKFEIAPIWHRHFHSSRFQKYAGKCILYVLCPVLYAAHNPSQALPVK